MKRTPLQILMLTSMCAVAGHVALLLTVTGCTREKPTGPLVVQAELREAAGAPVVGANLHLMTVETDGKGALTSVTEHFTISAITDGQGHLRLEIPRDFLKEKTQLSLGSNSPGGMPQPLRNSGALLTFKTDAYAREINLGEIKIVRK